MFRVGSAYRSVSTLDKCMVPVKKECAKAKMVPSKLFTKTARCDQGTDSHFQSEQTTRVEPFL